MLRRTLLEFNTKRRSFYAGGHQRRDMLEKPKNIPTSEGNKPRGFGNSQSGRKIRMVRRGGGELRTDRGAPPSIERKRGKSPYRKAARRKGMLANSVLIRLPILLDQYAPR